MDIFDLSTETELNSFVANKIQPTSDYLSRCATVVDRLVKFLQNCVPDELRPRRVIKGGSLGKGTVVVGKSDIDLTLMLVRYSQVRDLQRNMDQLLQKLELYLRSYDGVSILDRNPFCVQIEVDCHGGHKHEADILLTVDLLDIESSRDIIYEKMGREDSELLIYYSPSFVPLMMDMFSTLPTKLKSLIRLVKFWKSQVMINKNIKWPKSYGFEMVTVYAWMKAGEPTNFSMTRALHAVLTCLVNHRAIKADFGNRVYYSRRFFKPPRSGPYIIDPLDPYDDLYSRKGWDWNTTANMARMWLQSHGALFRSVNGSTETQW